MDGETTTGTAREVTSLGWAREMRELEWKLAGQLDFVPMTPDIEFVAFLRALSRFGYFTVGPLTIDVDLVEEILLRTHPRGNGGPEHPPVSPGFLPFNAHCWRIMKARGKSRIDEMQTLESFMTWPEGLPARVFGELGVSFEDVQRHLAGESRRELIRVTQGEKLYSTEEAATYLGVHVQTVRGWIRSGRLSASRLAGQKSIRIRESDLQAVLEPIDPQTFDGKD